MGGGLTQVCFIGSLGRSSSEKGGRGTLAPQYRLATKAWRGAPSCDELRGTGSLAPGLSFSPSWDSLDSRVLSKPPPGTGVRVSHSYLLSHHFPL